MLVVAAGPLQSYERQHRRLSPPSSPPARQLAGLLTAILAVLALRSVVAAITWIASGSTLWLLPNLLNEVWQSLRWTCCGGELGRARDTA